MIAEDFDVLPVDQILDFARRFPSGFPDALDMPASKQKMLGINMPPLNESSRFLGAADRDRGEQADLAMKVFELSQALLDRWLAADYAAKRKLLALLKTVKGFGYGWS